MTDPRETLARIRKQADAARTDVPALLDLADAVLERHVKAQPITAAYGTREGGDYCAACADDWPCPDYTAATTALEAIK